MTHTSITPEMIEAAEEAYMPFGDMGLAIQCALAAAPQPPEAAEQCQSCRTGSPYACTCPFKTHRNSDASCFEASQAQRVPLTDEQMRQMLLDAAMAAVPENERDRLTIDEKVLEQVTFFARATERAHGITQEKQG